jgi:hypothetical protein
MRTKEGKQAGSASKQTPGKTNVVGSTVSNCDQKKPLTLTREDLHHIHKDAAGAFPYETWEEAMVLVHGITIVEVA